MTIEELLGLEARLKHFVAHNNATGIRATVTSLCCELNIPSAGDPTLVVRDDREHALIARCADLLFSVRQPQPEALCAELLICSALQLVTSANTSRFIVVVRRALALAEASGSPQTIRRALNNCSVGEIQGGDPTLALTFVARAYGLSRELAYVSGEIGALCNAGAALQRLELHSECVGITLPEPPAGRLDTATANHATAGHFVNQATSHLVLNQHAKATQAASKALRLLSALSTPITIWYAITAQLILLRCAIHSGEHEAVMKAMRDVEGIARCHQSNRVDIIYEHAVAAYECYVGQHGAAVARLLVLRARTASLPTLHHDTLTLLQEAYEASGDHCSALACLADDVQCRGREQVARVAEILTNLWGAIHTILPAHSTAAALLNRLPSLPSDTTQSGALHKQTVAMQETFERLAVAAELSEDDSGRHIYRVGRLTGLLASQLGYDATAADAMERAARLHDIGKLGLPGALVARADVLSAAERKVMREHADIGRKILQQANDPAFDVACAIAFSHHERWDGSGYPQGLAGAVIPEGARLAALTEAFDVLTHGRAYQSAVTVTVTDALARLRQASGSHFEPRLVDALIKVVHRLHAEHGRDDVALSDYLGGAGTASSFLQARDSMHNLLGSLPSAGSATLLSAIQPAATAAALQPQPRARGAQRGAALPRSPAR